MNRARRTLLHQRLGAPCPSSLRQPRCRCHPMLLLLMPLEGRKGMGRCEGHLVQLKLA